MKLLREAFIDHIVDNTIERGFVKRNEIGKLELIQIFKQNIRRSRAKYLNHSAIKMLYYLFQSPVTVSLPEHLEETWIQFEVPIAFEMENENLPDLQIIRICKAAPGDLIKTMSVHKALEYIRAQAFWAIELVDEQLDRWFVFMLDPASYSFYLSNHVRCPFDACTLVFDEAMQMDRKKPCLQCSSIIKRHERMIALILAMARGDFAEDAEFTPTYATEEIIRKEPTSNPKKDKTNRVKQDYQVISFDASVKKSSAISYTKKSSNISVELDPDKEIYISYDFKQSERTLKMYYEMPDGTLVRSRWKQDKTVNVKPFPRRYRVKIDSVLRMKASTFEEVK